MEKNRVFLQIVRLAEYNSSYLLLLGKKKLQSYLKFHLNNFSYFEITTSLFLVPPSNKRRPSKLQN